MRKDIEKMHTGNNGNLFYRFLTEEDAIGVVEVILLLVVMVSAVALFKTPIIGLVTGILEKITSQSNKI